MEIKSILNILITGGLGYIGGRIAHYLITKNPNTNLFITTSNKNKILPRWTENFKILILDVLDENSIKECMKDRNIDVIIHLAALNEIESHEDPELALEVNTKGTYRLLKSAKDFSIKKFIYFLLFMFSALVLLLNLSELLILLPFILLMIFFLSRNRADIAHICGSISPIFLVIELIVV